LRRHACSSGESREIDAFEVDRKTLLRIANHRIGSFEFGSPWSIARVVGSRNDQAVEFRRVLELLHDEMTRAMGLLGVNTLAELNPSYLRAAPPVRVPHVLSAFPYIDGPDDRY